MQDEFNTGTIKGEPGNFVDVPPRDDDYAGLRKQFDMAQKVNQIINASPHQIFQRVTVDPHSNPTHPGSFVPRVKAARDLKPRATQIYTTTRLTGFPGSSGVHYLASATDLSVNPPVTLHMDSRGMGASTEMVNAYQQAFPGTTVKHSELAQETLGQLPYILNCHITANSNVLRHSRRKELHGTNGLLDMLKEADALSKGSNPFQTSAAFRGARFNRN